MHIMTWYRETISSPTILQEFSLLWASFWEIYELRIKVYKYLISLPKVKQRDSTKYGFSSPKWCGCRQKSISATVTFSWCVQYFTGTSTGALTYSLVKVLEYEPRLTYGRLLMEIGKRIYQAHSGQGQTGILPPHLLQVNISCNT